MYYPAAFIKHENSELYDVVFPDFWGCVSQGDSFEDAIRMAEEALCGHISIMLKDGDKLPTPSSLEEAEQKYKELLAEENLEPMKTIFQFVVADIKPAKENNPVRLSISLREKLVKEVDIFAEEMGITRSGLIAIATKDYLKRMSA